MKAVIVPYNDGFLACGIHIAAYGYGEEVEDALDELAAQLGEIKYECAAPLQADLSFVYGVGHHAYRRLAEEEWEERALPDEPGGRA